MRELSLNILDIAENSVKAGAKNIIIAVEAKDNVLSISIKDDGCGMDADFLKRVVDPYTTTRTTRKVGMGIPLIKMEAEMSGGEFSIKSEKGVGTEVITTFAIDNIDRPPLGDIADTLTALITCIKSERIVFEYKAFGTEFRLDTEEVKRELDGVPLTEPDVLVFLREMIKENVVTNFGGVYI